MSWDDLRRTLCEERQAYAALVNVLIREQQALRRMDRLALQELNESKERLFEHIAAYERERMKYLKALTGLDHPRDALTSLLHCSRTERSALHVIVAELMTVAVRAHALLDHNRMLIANGLQLVRGVIQAVAESCAGQIYGIGGCRSSAPIGLALNVRG